MVSRTYKHYFLVIHWEIVHVLSLEAKFQGVIKSNTFLSSFYFEGIYMNNYFILCCLNMEKENSEIRIPFSWN